MRRLVLLSGALALSVYGSVPASADTRSHAAGACGFVPLHYTFPAAVVVPSIALYSDNPKDNPVSADVTCLLLDGGGAVTGQALFSGTGVVYGAQVVPYELGPAERACTLVDFTSDATPDQISCVPLEDQLLCPLLRAMVPGVGPVAIVEEGDVYVAGTPVWDCPPYA